MGFCDIVWRYYFTGLFFIVFKNMPKIYYMYLHLTMDLGREEKGRGKGKGKKKGKRRSYIAIDFSPGISKNTN